MSYSVGVKKRAKRGRAKRGATPMNTALDVIKKAKKTWVNCRFRWGVWQKKVTFLSDRARKSGGITPTVRISDIP